MSPRRSHRTARRALAALSVACLLGLTACGSDGSDGRGASTGPTGSDSSGGVATAPSLLEPAAVAAALDFDAPLVGGGRFRGADHTARPVAFWFWAPT